MDKNSKIKSQFGREAKKYSTSAIHSNKEDLKYIVSIIKPEKYWKCIDIATGTGHMAIALSSYIRFVIAADITQEMLDEVSIHITNLDIKNIHPRIIDAHEILYDDEEFDLVTSRIAPHHFHSIDLAIEEMIRVTKKNGLIFIQDTISPEDDKAANLFNHIERLRDPSHVKNLKSSEWIDKFEKRGCELLYQDKRVKVWPLKWWTERMSTPKKKYDEIVKLLNESNDHMDYLDFKIDENNEWVIRPFNGYFLFKKII